MTDYIINNLSTLSAQNILALRAKRCDTYRDLSKELDNIMAEIQLIDRELNKRKETDNG